VSTLEALPIKGKATPIQIDVTSDVSVDNAVKYVEDMYGKVDILVNNAGIVSQNPNSRDAMRETLEVNVVGPLSVTEAFLPLLQKSEEPRIVFVSSSLGSLQYVTDGTRPFSWAATHYRAR
jgi:NAD(P)-dependent dehydrogenase (short-subunit alcohol dehydrogenase family)